MADELKVIQDEHLTVLFQKLETKREQAAVKTNS
jgi:hypothetical protein